MMRSKLILKGVDGVVFVADTQEERLDSNIESVEDLKITLKNRATSLKSFLTLSSTTREICPTAPRSRNCVSC